MIRILTADDHPIVRAGLRELLSEFDDISIEDEVSNGEEVLNKILTKDYDVVLLDISMPYKNGLDILKQLKSKKPEIKILILTMHPEDEYALRALKSGASGYITKDSIPRELVSAIRKVAGGSKYVSNDFMERFFYNFGTDIEKAPFQSLTDREYHILLMIISGKKLVDIADDLFLSVKTISSYRSRILQKLKLKNNAELVRYAINNKIFPDSLK